MRPIEEIHEDIIKLIKCSLLNIGIVLKLSL